MVFHGTKRFTSTQHLTKQRTKMIELKLMVPEALAPELEALAKKLAHMMEEDEGLLTMEVQDQCVAEAIRVLQREKVIKSPRDFAWIMMVMNQQVLEDFEGCFTALAFISYLKSLGIEGCPGKTSLYDNCSLVLNDFPEWEFADDPTHSEVVRRRNVGKRFLNVYSKVKRSYAEGISEK